MSRRGAAVIRVFPNDARLTERDGARRIGMSGVHLVTRRPAPSRRVGLKVDEYPRTEIEARGKDSCRACIPFPVDPIFCDPI
jgi:hypothetical protein